MTLVFLLVKETVLIV